MVNARPACIAPNGLDVSCGDIGTRCPACSAIETSRQEGIGIRKALIVQAAVESGCTRLLSDDLQDGRDFGGVVVENPFA